MWAGLVVALGTYLLIQLLLIAVGVTDVENPTTGDAVASGAAALAAFLLGGATAGATAMWRGIDDGLLHGVVLWGTGLLVLFVLSAAGGGAALGAIDTGEAFDGLTQADVEEALDVASPSEAAGRALGALTAALAASAVGGLLGAKLWPRGRAGDVDARRSSPAGDGGPNATGRAASGRTTESEAPRRASPQDGGSARR